MTLNWRDLHERLTRCSWFSHVGEPTDRDDDPTIRRAHSWAKAAEWAAKGESGKGTEHG